MRIHEYNCNGLDIILDLGSENKLHSVGYCVWLVVQCFREIWEDWSLF